MDLDRIWDGEAGYVTTFPDGTVFHYRLLTQKEFHVIDTLLRTGQLIPDIAASLVFKRCLHGNWQLLSGDLMAGYEISVGRLILYMSGGGDVEQAKEELASARSSYNATDLLETMKRLICVAYPTYIPSQLECMDRQQLIKLFVQAEAMMKARNPEYKPLELKDIKTPGQLQPGQKIDFAAENRELAGKVGKDVFGDEPARALNPKQIQQMKRKERMQNR